MTFSKFGTCQSNLTYNLWASGIEVNKTYVSYSSVGKKSAVMKAVNKAIENVALKGDENTDGWGNIIKMIDE